MNKLNAIIQIIAFFFTKKEKETVIVSDRITKQEVEIETGEERRTPSIIRTTVTGLTIASVALLSHIEKKEGYIEIARPDPIGIPTGGYGTIKHRTGENAGQAVKNGDVFTKEKANAELLAYLNEMQPEIIKSLKKDNGEYVELYQEEFDIIVDFVYNMGVGNWNKSSMRKYYLQGDYINACNAYALYKYANGKDCSIRANGCYGVYSRSIERRDNCLNAGAKNGK